MNLKDILSISGKPGLFKLVASSKNSVIVQSLIDGKKTPVHAAHKISSLEDISIYTYEEDIPLAQVFQNIFDKEDGGKTIDHKSDSATLRSYMTEVLPDYDEDRVYNSDLKKLFQWYNVMHENNLLESEEEDSELIEDAEVIEETGAEESDSKEKE